MKKSREQKKPKLKRQANRANQEKIAEETTPSTESRSAKRKSC